MSVGVQCPISSSLGEFPSYWDWFWCPGLSPVLVSIALPFALHTCCFPFALICHWISIVFLLCGRRSATLSVDPSLTHFLGEFPGSMRVQHVLGLTVFVLNKRKYNTMYVREAK